MGLREKAFKIARGIAWLDLKCVHQEGAHDNLIREGVDKILSLILPEGIEWVGECHECFGDFQEGVCIGTNFEDCESRIKRPATLEEVMEILPSALKSARGTGWNDLIVNNGQLRIKDL